MKLTTLNRSMKPLLSHGLIVEADVGESTGGRKPILYDVNPGRYYIIGIDISRTYTQVVITNLKMKILHTFEFEMTSSHSPYRTVDLISDWLISIYEKTGIETTEIIGVGLGIVGPLRREEGKMVGAKGFDAPGWEYVPIKSIIEHKLQLPVSMDNGANTAALAEYFFGWGKDLSSIAYINCGVGIRAGVISSGHLVRTINDAEDALGHMIIDVDGELCICGNHGCIECYSTIPAIEKRFISTLKKGRSSIVTKDMSSINYMDILEATEHGDTLAREVIIDSALIFGAGISNYINLVNPQLIILSGPLIKYSDTFYKITVDTAMKKSYLAKDHKIHFIKGGYFKDNVIAVGAAVMVIEELLGRDHIEEKS
ncbi:MAG: ROK family protein [Caldicoprobacterales bacterium]